MPYRSFVKSIVVATAILLLSVGHFSELPGENVENADKIVHFIMYFSLAFVLGRDLYSVRQSLSASWWTVTVLLPSLFGVLMEAVQFFLPYRSASLFDMAANISGAAVGTALSFVVIDRFIRKKS
ncbi:MAG: VanZ family protein [bacterium]|uniref:VanZ family protein n=1 Tax=Candidatus Aphodosoma intestinipullorum TaxID=2840674 RepID=A0A940DLN0_9BACT|nr:VanZ family protein [Candidatus Aphodosoma intestinipullorum]